VFDDPSAGSQYRALTNTILGMLTSSTVGFILSKWLRGKWRITDLQTTIIAGGVAMAGAHSIIVPEWGALIVGAVAGTISMFSLIVIQPFLVTWCKLNDVRNTFSTFFLPAMLCWAAGTAAYGIYVDPSKGYRSFGGQRLSDLFSHTDMAIRNFGAWIISLCIGCGSGLISGLVINGLKKVIPPPSGQERLSDEAGFRVGYGF